MSAADLIAAFNSVVLEAEQSKELRRQIDEEQYRFEDQSRRMAMKSEDLELTYSL